METERLEKWIAELQSQIDLLTRRVKNLETPPAQSSTRTTKTTTTKKERAKE